MAAYVFRKSLVILASVASVLGVSAISQYAVAQQAPGTGQGRPGAPPVTGQVGAPRPGSTTIQLPEPAQLQITPFRVMPFITIDPSLLANMSGWTRVTEGASKGSVAVVRLGESAYFVAVGQDDQAYAAPMSITALSLDTTAWRALSSVGRPGITCNASPRSAASPGWGNRDLVACFGLTASGGARKLVVGRFSGQSTLYGSFEELGGSNAGNLPLGIEFVAAKGFPTPVGSTGGSENDVVSITTVIADNGLWRRVETVTGWTAGGLGAGSYVPTLATSWQRIDGLDATSAAACLGDTGRVFCAFSASGGRVRMIDRVAPSGSSAPGVLTTNTAWSNAIVSPAAPGGAVTSAPAIARHPSGRITVVVRGANGRLLRTVYTPTGQSWSAWTDMGGFLRPDTQPSCIADGEVPVCVIQGADGGGYARRLPAAQGV